MDPDVRHPVSRALLQVAGAGRRTLGIDDSPTARRWAVAAFINALGTGLLLPLSVLYFTIHVGLSAASVGLGMTIGGAIALGVIPLGGILVDRLGPKAILLGAWALAAAAYASFAVVSAWPEMLAVVTAAEIAAAVGATAGKVFITELAARRERVKLLASQQSLGNLGFALGGLLATAALAIGGSAYLLVVCGDAASFLVAIALVAPIAIGPWEPAAAARARAGGLRLVLADRRYVALSALDGLTTFQDGALQFALPLWVVLHTDAPRALAGILFTLNTVVVVLFQVRATAGVRSVADVPRSYRRAAVLMALCAAAYLAAHYADATSVSISLLVVGLLLHTATEIFASAGEWTASVELADESHRGAYLSVYRLGYAAQNMVAPLVVTSLLALGAVWLWPVLAVLVVTGALASVVVTSRIAADPPPMTADRGRRELGIAMSAGSVTLSVAVAATMIFATSARATTGTSLLYQCPDGTHICSVAPEGGAPVQLAQTGTLAGVTRGTARPTATRRTGPSDA